MLMSSMQKKMGKKSFTILELLIVIAILGIVLATYPLTVNFSGQIAKAQDGRRKQDLATLKKAFEDFYSDHNRYPYPSEVCFGQLGRGLCLICGNNPASPSFSPYLAKLPCDPQSQAKEYRYRVDDPDIPPTWYVLYTLLSNKDDPAIGEVCPNLCIGGNYAVSSDNVAVDMQP